MATQMKADLISRQAGPFENLHVGTKTSKEGEV